MTQVIRYFDLYDKLYDSEYKLQTLSGKILSFILTFFGISLVFGQYLYYQQPIVFRDLAVEPVFCNNGDTANISLSIMVGMPCFFLHFDVLDSVGFMQLALNKSIQFNRIARNGSFIGVAKESVINVCMSCRGLLPDSECCNSCEQIEMISVVNGKPFIPSEWEQCNQTDNIDEYESCLIEGSVPINKVDTHIHIAPGRNIPGDRHSHDMSFQYPNLSLPHYINYFYIGEESDLLSIPLKDHRIRQDTVDPKVYRYSIMATPLNVINNTVMIHQFYEYSLLETHTDFSHNGYWPGIYFLIKFMPYGTTLRYYSKNLLHLLISSTGLLAGVYTMLTLLQGILQKDWSTKVPAAFKAPRQPVLAQEKEKPQLQEDLKE